LAIVHLLFYSHKARLSDQIHVYRRLRVPASVSQVQFNFQNRF
jgi:hypothetical protein